MDRHLFPVLGWVDGYVFFTSFEGGQLGACHADFSQST